MSAIHRGRDGLTICEPHRRSGRPIFHTDGCELCEAARDRGEQRPNAKDATPKERMNAGSHAGGFGYRRSRRLTIVAPPVRRFSKGEIAALNEQLSMTRKGRP